MRSTQKCPKCSGKRLAALNEFRVPTQDTSNTAHPFPPITIERSQQVGTSFWDRGVSHERRSLGSFEAWICLGCGYTEFYASGLELIGELAQEFPDQLRVLGDAPQGQGPFR